MLSSPAVLRRLLLVLCSVVLLQETNLGSLLIGAECFETCPEDTSPGHCTPICATCACGTHASPLSPRPVKVAAPVSRVSRPFCEAVVPPADCAVEDILHVPKALSA